MEEDIFKGSSYTLRKMLEPLFIKGKKCLPISRCYENQIIVQRKGFLWEETKRFLNPHEVYVDLSQELYDLKNNLIDELHNSYYE